jgi:hypothetical protein
MLGFFIILQDVGRAMFESVTKLLDTYPSTQSETPKRYVTNFLDK